MDFLRSGHKEVHASITALAAKGYEGIQVTFNADSPPWLSLIWQTVTEGDALETVDAIVNAVHSVDPRAVRI